MDDTSKSDIYQRWDDGFVIRRMRSDEDKQISKWITAYRVLGYELEVVMEMRGANVDDDGFYVGELNGEMVASLVVTPVADDLRYVGLLYVVECHRRSGFTRRMLTTARDVEQRRNFTGIVCLTTFLDKKSMYAKFGYETTVEFTRFQGVVSSSTVSTNVDRNGCGTDVREVTVQLSNSLVHCPA